MTLNDQRRLSKHICRLLKVNEINFPIGRTSKGNLGLVFNANTNDFEMMLDSVPLSTRDSLNDENNIELKKMIEKYMFMSENIVYKAIQPGPSVKEMTQDYLNKKRVDSLVGPEVESDTVTITVKKRGRPIGSKNVKKTK